MLIITAIKKIYTCLHSAGRAFKMSKMDSGFTDYFGNIGVKILHEQGRIIHLPPYL